MPIPFERAKASFESKFARAQAFVEEAETDSAIEAFGGCITWLEELLRTDPIDPRLQRWLAISYASQAEVLSQAGKVEHALDTYTRAESLFEQVHQRAGASIPELSDLVMVQGKLLDALMEIGDLKRIRPVADKLEMHLGSVCFVTGQTDPGVLEIRAAGHSEVGRYFEQWGPKRKASWHQAQAAALLENALSFQPDDNFLHLNLAITCFLCGQSHNRIAAKPWFEKSYDLLKTLQLRIELPPQGEQVLEKVRCSLGWEPLYGRGGRPTRVVRLG